MIQVETQLDPTKELRRLISECKYDEAFTIALQRSDLAIVSWLCSQVFLVLSSLGTWCNGMCDFLALVSLANLLGLLWLSSQL